MCFCKLIESVGAIRRNTDAGSTGTVEEKASRQAGGETVINHTAQPETSADSRQDDRPSVRVCTLRVECKTHIYDIVCRRRELARLQSFKGGELPLGVSYQMCGLITHHYTLENRGQALPRTLHA